MAFVHGKGTVILVAGFSSPAPSGSHDISIYVTTSTMTRGADDHDVTTYGKNDHVHQGGLITGQFTMQGIYDSSTTAGPRYLLAKVFPQVGTITRRPEGTGSGKPEEVFQALMTNYSETNPVADMISWQADFTVSDAVTFNTQP